MVYKWAEHRVTQEKAVDEDENFNLFEAIKTELSTIFPRIKFYKMTFEFLIEFVVGKGFVISPAELSKKFLSWKEFYDNEQNSFKTVRF
uniref:Uncharacterized protein n=1 Tax=Panagrolaimus superbus TaxID=310955 RepID=A0A914YQ78_9BILA